MKKKVMLFLLLFLIPCFVFAEESKESLVTNTNKLSFDISNGVMMPMGNSIKVADGYIMQAIGENTKVVRKLDFEGNLIWEVDSVKNNSDEKYIHLINDKDLFIIGGRGVLKVNINDGTVISENSSITGMGLVSLNGKYFSIGSSINVFNENLEISNTFKLDDLCKQLTNLTGYFSVRAYYNDNGKIYLLCSFNSGSEYEYYIFSFSKEDLSDLKIEAQLSFEDKKWKNFAELIKLGDTYYANSDALYKITSDGVGTAIAGKGVETPVLKSYTGIVYNDNYFLLSGLAEDSEKKVAAVVDIYDKELNLLETINLNNLYGYEFLEPFRDNKDNQISVAKNISLIDGGFITMGIIDGEIQFLSEYKFPYNIETKTDDNGEIEVITEAFSGDMITFNVRARNGYKLSTLSVTNSLLETVTFTEDELILNEDGTFSLSRNSFKMPSSDVEINATFEKIPDNPNTIDNIVFYTGMFVVSLCLITGLVLYKKKYS